MKSLLLLAVICAVARGLPTAEVIEARSQNVTPLSQLVSVVRAVRDCISGDVSLCLKEKALRYVESITENTELNLTDGITLLEDENAKPTRESESLSEEPRAREEQIDSRLMDVVTDFLETRTLQLRVPSDMQRALEEGRKKKKKKKLLKKLMPLISLLKLKFAALIPLFLGFLAIVAVKALFLLKISLLSSSAGLIRSLFSSLKNKGGGGGGSSYEAVLHSSSQDEYPYPASNSNSGWGRDMNDAQDLAYSGHIAS